MDFIIIQKIFSTLLIFKKLTNCRYYYNQWLLTWLLRNVFI